MTPPLVPVEGYNLKSRAETCSKISGPGSGCIFNLYEDGIMDCFLSKIVTFTLFNQNFRTHTEVQNPGPSDRRLEFPCISEYPDR